MICCRDIMTLPSLRELKLVAGQGGLNRVLRWGHVLDMPDVLSWVQGGELLIMTGIAIQNDELALLKIIEEIAKKGLAGLVINIGPYIPGVSQQLIQLANSLDFPVFTLPWEVKLVEVTKDISSYIILRQMEEKAVQNLLESILFSEMADYSLLANRASQYGYEINRSYRVGILCSDDFPNFLKSKEIVDEVAILHIKIQMQQVVEQVIKNHGWQALSLLHMDSIIFLIPSDYGIFSKNNDIVTAITDILKEIVNKFPKLNVQIGMGMAKSHLTDFKESLKQAKQALLFMEVVEGNSNFCFFEQLGIYKLLFKLDHKDLQIFYQETVGLLVEYDKVHGTKLVNNLIGLFKANGNVNQAADQLYVHRNTLRYRLQKIEEITGRSLTVNTDCTTLQLAIMAGRVLRLLPD